MAVGEKKVSAMAFLASVPDDAKIYVVKLGDTTPYYTTKAALLAGLNNSKIPVNLRAQYNGTSVTVPTGFTLTRIISLNDINTEFTGTVAGTSLPIDDGVTDDIYLIDGYTN